MIGVCPTKELLVAERAWVRSFWEALRPYSTSAGSYVNAMSEFEEDRIRTSYGPVKYERLAQDQGAVRPGERLSRQRQHQAGLSQPHGRPVATRPQVRGSFSRSRDSSRLTGDVALARGWPGGPLPT